MKTVMPHRRSANSFLATALSLVFSSVWATAAYAAPARTYKGYLFQQQTPNQGSVTMYLTPRHWLMRCAMFTIVVDEDEESIIAFTRQTNKYIKDSLKVGVNRFGTFRHGGDFNWGPAKQVGHGDFQGHKTLLTQRSGQRTDMKVKNDVVVTEREEACPDFPVSKTFQEIAFALFSQDYSHGMVVRVSRMAHSANPRYCTIRPVMALETSVCKERTFSPYDFSLPPGLTKCKSEIEMFSNDEDMPIENIPQRMRKRADQLNIKTKE